MGHSYTGDGECKVIAGRVPVHDLDVDSTSYWRVGAGGHCGGCHA